MPDPPLTVSLGDHHVVRAVDVVGGRDRYVASLRLVALPDQLITTRVTVLDRHSERDRLLAAAELARRARVSEEVARAALLELAQQLGCAPLPRRAAPPSAWAPAPALPAPPVWRCHRERQSVCGLYSRVLGTMTLHASELEWAGPALIAAVDLVDSRTYPVESARLDLRRPGERYPFALRIARRTKLTVRAADRVLVDLLRRVEEDDFVLRNTAERMPTGVLEARARHAGIPHGALHRAMRRVGVRSRPVGYIGRPDSGWYVGPPVRRP